MQTSSTATTTALQQHLDWIRNQFPALNLQIAGRPAVYFDGPGGTQVPQRVIDAIADYFRTSNANTHGHFETSRRSDAVISSARDAIADFLGCDASEVAFGPNMTTLTFALSRALGRDLRDGDEIVVTNLDHDANVAPWRALEELGCTIRTADIHTDDCTINLDDLEAKITPKTKLVAIGYASNAVGTINPVAKIVKMAHAVGAMAFVDAVHYAPHGPIDVRALDCDFLACSVYKFFGPHIGVLFGKHEHLERLTPYKVRPSSDEVPSRWETGTHNIEGLAGVSAAISYFTDLGKKVDPSVTTRHDALKSAWHVIREYEAELSRTLITRLLDIPGLTFYGNKDLSRLAERTPTVAIRIEGQTPAQLAKALGDRGIFTWDGNYYALNLSERLGVESKGGMLRIGLVHYNTMEEVDYLIKSIREITRK
jgi:cysteine desulfurase family protein (TIGR01976 family)